MSAMIAAMIATVCAVMMPATHLMVSALACWISFNRRSSVSRKSPLALFKHEKFGSLRVVRSDQGDPWFVAKDVCVCLEIGNSRDAVASLDFKSLPQNLHTDASLRISS